MSGCHPTNAQEQTYNCLNCHTTHFVYQIARNNGKCTSCGTLFALDFPTQECTCKCHVSQNTCCEKCTYPENFIDALRFNAAMQDHHELDAFKQMCGLNPPTKEEKSKIVTDALKRLAMVELCLKELQTKFIDLEAWKHVRFTKFNNKPYKCPVCEGSGFNKPELKTVDAKISIDGVECKAGDTIYWKSVCKACEGKGIVWG